MFRNLPVLFYYCENTLNETYKYSDFKLTGKLELTHYMPDHYWNCVLNRLLVCLNDFETKLTMRNQAWREFIENRNLTRVNRAKYPRGQFSQKLFLCWYALLKNIKWLECFHTIRMNRHLSFTRCYFLLRGMT